MGVVSKQALDNAIKIAYKEKPWWLPKKFAWNIATGIVDGLTKQGLISKDVFRGDHNA